MKTVLKFIAFSLMVIGTMDILCMKKAEKIPKYGLVPESDRDNYKAISVEQNKLLKDIHDNKLCPPICMMAVHFESRLRDILTRHYEAKIEDALRKLNQDADKIEGGLQAIIEEAKKILSAE